MRTYVVQPGDSPAGIASRESMAGCPKCGGYDLVRVNPLKESITYPNGFQTFRSLCVGEIIHLPDKWFEPRFELLPPAYFGSLPYADGYTPSPFGELAPKVLQAFRTLDDAADAVKLLASQDGQSFANYVGDTAVAIDRSIQDAPRSQYTENVQAGIDRARMCTKILAAAIGAGASLSAPQARADILYALNAALENAQHAVRDQYATLQPPEHA